ncbi:beta-lactamase-like protein [Favolaschia claudopus]|uniref:Beta-lactamase-like protein n=1 Tax=Favolaschia claudopus TaxID=2862362 RepID=A0AAW0DE56_9AGAR
MPPISPAPVEFIFLGTGTSGSLPYIDCITSPRKDEPCRTCLSTLKRDGRRNIRRNTSGVLKMSAQDGREVTIVIDVGKTFQAASLEWFPKFGLRRIDAVLLTHGHADAMNGLDDLRAWTLYGLIQAHVDIYLSQETFEAVQRCFPYLVSHQFASGGGDVSALNWHIINDKVPFEINDTGIQVIPFAVHHGFKHASAAFVTQVQLPTISTPSDAHGENNPDSASSALAQLSPYGSKYSLEKLEPYPQPFHSFGFKIADHLIYISDVSHVPDDVWPLIVQPPKNSSTAIVPVCVLDCLQIKPHNSHMSVAQSLATARRIGAQRTYLTGFCHEATHEEFVTITSVVGGAVQRPSSLSKKEARALATIEPGNPVWVRPAYDGLRVVINPDRTVNDGTKYSILR